MYPLLGKTEKNVNKIYNLGKYKYEQLSFQVWIYSKIINDY